MLSPTCTSWDTRPRSGAPLCVQFLSPELCGPQCRGEPWAEPWAKPAAVPVLLSSALRPPCFHRELAPPPTCSRAPPVGGRLLCTPPGGPSLSGHTQCSRGGVSPAKAINRLGVEGGNCGNCPIHRRLEKLPCRASSSGPGACVLLLFCCRRSRPTFLPFIEGMSSGQCSTRSPSRAAPSSEAQCSLDACDVNPPPPAPGSPREDVVVPRSVRCGVVSWASVS